MKNQHFWWQNLSIFRLPKGVPPTSAWVISGWPRMAARCSAVCPVAERSSMSARSASSAKTEAFRASRRLSDGDWPGETIKSDCSYQWWKQFCNQTWRFFMEFSRYKSWFSGNLHSGRHTKNYGKWLLFMGKSTISMAIFNSYVSLPEGTSNGNKFGKLGGNTRKNWNNLENMQNITANFGERLGRKLNFDEFRTVWDDVGESLGTTLRAPEKVVDNWDNHFWIRYIESGKVERLWLHKWGKIRTWTSLLTKKQSKQWEHRPYRPSRHLTTFHSHTQRRTRVLPCPVPKYRCEKRCN